MFRSITYLSLMASFILSFFVFKMTDDNFAYMRLSFAFILLVCSLPIFVNNAPKGISKTHLVLILLLLVIIVTSSLGFARLLFIFVFFCLPFFINKPRDNLSWRKSYNTLFKHLYYFYIVVSLFHLYHNDASVRFSGFSISATSFSVYIVAFFIMFIFTNKPKYVYLHFLLVFWLIYVSQTRSVLIILIVSFAVFTCRNFINNHLKKTSLLLIITLLLTLPIASAFSNGFNFLSRYESNQRDDSTYTRLFYYNNQVNAMSESSLLRILYGYGIDDNGKVGVVKSGSASISQHNDFFVLLYDYGIIFSILFLCFLLYKVNSAFSLVILLIYLTSFYHNMIYDYWLITLFYLSSLSSVKTNNYVITREKKTV